MTDSVREATAAELEDWDAHTVKAPGGHVYQSRAWADHRAASGWRPRFLVSGDGFRLLALQRPWPLLGGASSYIPRGPVPTDADPARTAERLLAAASWLAERGVDVIASDAEVPAATEYPVRIRAAGFRPIEEIQPSRHRVSLSLEGGEAAVLGRIDKATRNRIRRAERGLSVGELSVGEVSPSEEPDFDGFYDLLRATGERRQFGFGPRTKFVPWWRRAFEAGHLLLLEARAGGDPIAALLCYRHGGRLSTVHSADRAELRSEHPGALALLRWRAIQRAVREGCAEMDLGGVDVRGARREPREGEPMYGLYQHKLAFGAVWFELAGAHERVARPWRYAAGRVAARIARVGR